MAAGTKDSVRKQEKNPEPQFEDLHIAAGNACLMAGISYENLTGR